MSDHQRYDAIVVGAGVAGLCCAGELVRQGLRPLLLCETGEVAYNLRPEIIKGNSVPIQAPVFSPTSQGGWWLPLGRALGARFESITAQLPFSVSLWGGDPGDIRSIRQVSLSAASAVDQFTAVAPFPIDEYRDELERLMEAALALPFDELTELYDKPWTEWLDEQGAEGLPALFMSYVSSLGNMLPLSESHRLSVWGALSILRGTFLGEAYFPEAYPDYRAGVFIPLAQAIERKGGTIVRRVKVANVVTDGDQVVGVRLADGTEYHADVVAIATGNPRIPKLFDTPPPEVAALATTDYGEADYAGYFRITLYDRAVLPATFDSFFGVLCAEEEWFHWMWPSHERCPWGVEEGKQILVSVQWMDHDRVAAMGGQEGLFKKMAEVERTYFPEAESSAIEEVTEIVRGGMWYSQVLLGPKLERRSPSVRGLWYVGDGSVPLKAIWTEAAASTGILGARGIAEQRLRPTATRVIVGPN